MLEQWWPDLKYYYDSEVGKLLKENSELKAPFHECAFMGLTVNMGPEASCVTHRDFLNLSFGLCCIMVFGDFDHTKGGHRRVIGKRYQHWAREKD